jgi:hypothetical protein
MDRRITERQEYDLMFRMLVAGSLVLFDTKSSVITENELVVPLQR